MNRFPFISLFRPTQAKNKPRFTRGLPFFQWPLTYDSGKAFGVCPRLKAIR